MAHRRIWFAVGAVLIVSLLLCSIVVFRHAGRGAPLVNDSWLGARLWSEKVRLVGVTEKRVIERLGPPASVSDMGDGQRLLRYPIKNANPDALELTLLVWIKDDSVLKVEIDD